MKTILTFFLVSLFLQSPNIEAQNQPFYAGISLGVGGTFTHLDENVGKVQLVGINYPLPVEVLLGYRLNNSFAVQLTGGFHNKTYQVSPDKFFQNANAPTIGYGFGQNRSSPHIGVNLLYRKSIGTSSKHFIGGLIGYSRIWYYADRPSTGTCNDFEGSVFPKDCEDGGVIVNFDFEEANNHFLTFGAFYEKTIGKNANRTLRLGLNYRKGGGKVTPVGGEIYYFENDERAETVNFYSNGSMLSFEVGYMFGFGKEKN
ncbi:MAG: hypothetical protein R3E32_10020 [Chitinophagales bacterium]